MVVGGMQQGQGELGKVRNVAVRYCPKLTGARAGVFELTLTFSKNVNVVASTVNFELPSQYELTYLQYRLT